MDVTLRAGRYCFAISVVYFGVQYFLSGQYIGGMPPVPPWAPGGRWGAYLVGAVLIATGAALVANVKACEAALVVAGVCLFCVVFLHLSHFSDIWNKGTDRTRVLEPLALGGAALVLASLLGPEPESSFWAARIGRFLFAFSLVIFGAQHFMYAQFIANLIPAWIPGHLFWVYLTGAGMICTGLGIVTNFLGRLGSWMIGLMFLLWTLLLHAPRVAGSVHNHNEWANLFVALAMSGASFIVAESLGTVSVPAKSPGRLRASEIAG